VCVLLTQCIYVFRMIPTIPFISMNNINWLDSTLETDFVLREVGTEILSIFCPNGRPPSGLIPA